MRKLLAVLGVLLVGTPALSKELLYKGSEFTLRVPAKELVTIEVPCEVTSLAYPKLIQVRDYKAPDKTIVYVLTGDRPAVLTTTCVDRSYTFKLFPVDLTPKKELECKNGKCEIKVIKPKVSLKEIDTHFVVYDPSVVQAQTGGKESSFASKEEIIDSAVKLMSAMIKDRKPQGYVVRRVNRSYYLTDNLKVNVLKFWKGRLYGQLVEVVNDSYFPTTLSVKSLDGNGNVLIYSPSMDRDGVIHFRPHGRAYLYVVSVKKQGRLPYKVVNTGEEQKSSATARVIPVLPKKYE